MKKCAICGCEIINGKNGCMLSDACFACKPIYYPPQKYSAESNYYSSMGDDAATYWENMIFDRQEKYYDD